MTDDERHMQYLAMIQEVIARMAANSFTIKGWSTTLVSAILAFLADGKPQHAWIALLPATVFWLLDAYYLALERAFRALYDSVRTGDRVDFSMAPPSWKPYMAEALFRPAVFSLYLMLTIVTVAVWCFMH